MKYLLLLLLPFGLGAQNATFTAICNAKTVTVGTPFELTFRVDNDEIKTITPPDLKNFDIVGGPNSSKSMSYINGVGKTSEAYSFVLAATKPGDFTIGAAKVTTKSGKTLSSAPIKISVSKGNGNGGGNEDGGRSDLGEKVLLRLEASNTDAVIGEQVVVDLKIYSQIGIEQIELVREPEATNMFSHQVQTFNDETTLEVVNGKQYKSKILRRLVLFPSKTGKISLESAVAQLGIVEDGNNGLFSVFQRLQTYNIESNSVNIQVKALDGAPSNFAGAVGDYTMQAYLEKNTITSDDVIQIKMRITGNGDIKQIMPPSLNLPANQFEVFPPNIQEDIRENRGMLGGVKEIEYIVTPKVVGEVVIRPELVFFHPQKRQFVKIDTTLTVQIVQGNKQLPPIETTSANTDTTAIPKEFTNPQSETNLYRPSGSWMGSISFWLLALLPVAGAAGWAYWYEKKRAERAAITEEMLRRKHAGREAHKRLAAAQQALQAGRSSDFYDAISKALLGYASDKLGIPTSRLTHDTLREEWKTMEMPDTFVRDWAAVVQSCEMALFGAGISNSEQMKTVYNQAAALMENLEKKLAEV